MTKLKDKVVAITGAGSGIGRSLAQKTVARGAHVALSDVNEAGLAETAESLRSAGPRVSTHVVDVRNKDAVFSWAAECEKVHGGVDAIINNAGVSSFATVEEMAYEQFELVIDVCLWGVVHGVKAFLPLLRKRPEGHVVNISSINAFVPMPYNAPYNMAKSAVLGLSETLMQELGSDPIHVTVVHPGGIKTNIANASAGVDPKRREFFNEYAAQTTADACAERILRGVERNQQRVYVGTDAQIMSRAKRFAPAMTIGISKRVWERI